MSRHKPMVGSAAIVAMALSAQPAAAHHSYASFDLKKDVTFAGVVTEFEWTNPHCWMRMKVVDARGQAVDWAFELMSPNTLVESGWRRSSLAAGARVTVTFHPLLNGKAGGSVVSVKFADGRTLKNQ